MTKLQVDWVKHKIDVEKYSNKSNSLFKKIRSIFTTNESYIYKPIIRG